MHFSICGCAEEQPVPDELDPFEKDIPTLIKFLEEGDTKERCQAAYRLKEIGPYAKEATPALIKSLQSPVRELKGNSSEAIRSIGVDTIPYIYEALDDPDWEIRAAALRAARIFPKAFLKILPDLIDLLDDDQYEIRVGAIGVIGSIGPDAADAAKLLAELLAGDPDISQFAVCNALAHIGEAAGSAVPVLINQLQIDTTQTIGLTIQTLGDIGPGATEAIPYLIELLGDETKPELESKVNSPHFDFSEGELPTTGDRAARALGKMGSEAIPALVDAFTTTDQNIRIRAIYAILEIGPDAKGAAPALIEAVEDDDPEIRGIAARCLGLIGPEPGVVQAIVKALDDKNYDVQKKALYAVQIFEPKNTLFIKPLIKIIDERDNSRNYLAIRILGEYGPAATDALPRLYELLEFGSSTTKIAIEVAIQKIENRITTDDEN